ncbi:mariner transposase [Trichonephila clavipes]|nr:mariner transposase [Trichonephila clavipes]
MDETWVHHFTPETKEQPKQWTDKGELTPKKVKTVSSAGKEEIKQKRSHLAKKKVLFHQDNAPAHKSVIATAKIKEIKFELLLRAPCSPD